MTIRTDWDILSELIPSNELSITRESGFSPTHLWAERCKKTHEWSVAFFKDFDARKRLAHLNSISSTEDFPYEGAHPDEMFNFWQTLIGNLPPDLVGKIGEPQYRELCEGFVPYNDDCNVVAERIRNGKLVVLQSGISRHSTLGEGHAIYFVFCKGYMLICNRGYNLPEFSSSPTITAYKLGPKDTKDPNGQCPPSVVDAIASCKTYGDETNMYYLYRDLLQDFNAIKDEVCLQIETLTTGKQKVGNCTSVNCKEALLGALALLSLDKDSSSLSAETLARAKATKREISAHARASELQAYYQQHIGNEEDVLDRHLARLALNKTIKQLNKAGIDPERYPALRQIDQLCPEKVQESKCWSIMNKTYNVVRSYINVANLLIFNDLGNEFPNLDVSLFRI